MAGLSPRVRGNRDPVLDAHIEIRSIPARAGEPACTWDKPEKGGVYPRACGGTRLHLGQAGERWGLSPRVRGNRSDRRTRADKVRSIPARAGEPRSHPLRWYDPVGLSPRVRGNPPVPAPVPAPFRSIPARAGEPPAIPRSSSTSPVYPRACGGTNSSSANRNSLMGLSPRVRGNQPRADGPITSVRSIPARAGEPG